ncbi:hypothetical protein T265_02010 [Opisthorchis viverrini]|uniref:Uncharacterized protein n=1 Tax=Opisthorchis viverrini TaxID=6198 RepID=A0A075AIK1_OPIVI|nr:hypothetical protein T265_02010 [Opisthorchis viverrini]KER31774.1 hypothetical protein T265_02010 [Opisthorchis viverrini]
MGPKKGETGRGLSRLEQPGSIPARVPPSCGMTARHRKGVTAERSLLVLSVECFLQTRFTLGQNLAVGQIDINHCCSALIDHL